MQPFFVACLYVTTNFITFGYQNNCLNYNITISKPCTALYSQLGKYASHRKRPVL